MDFCFFFFSRHVAPRALHSFPTRRSSDLFISKRRISGMALLILALLQRIFLMSSLMLLLVWLIFFMVLIKLLPILGTISGKKCYNVLPQLDINNTIDHRPEGDEKWFLENEKTVTQFCRKLAAERPLKDIRDEYNYPKKKGIKDECSRLLEASTMKSRRGFAIQRL